MKNLLKKLSEMICCLLFGLLILIFYPLAVLGTNIGEIFRKGDEFKRDWKG